MQPEKAPNAPASAAPTSAMPVTSLAPAPGGSQPPPALWRRLLAPPIFPGDETKTRNAAFLNVILLTGIFSQIFAPIMWSGSPLRQVTMTSVMLGICLGGLILVRKGFVYAASLIHCILFWLMCTVAVTTVGGISAPGFTGFVLAIGCAGMLLGWRWMTGFTLATIAVGLALTIGEVKGYLNYDQFHDQPLEAWITQSIILTFIAIFLGLAMRYLRQSHDRAQKAMEARIKQEAALRQVERNYHEIYNATSEAILIHDAATGAVLDANRTALERFGFQPDMLGDLRLSDLREEKTLAARGEALARFDLARQEGPQVFEWLCVGRGNNRFWAEVSLRRADIGGRTCVLTVLRDISERRKIEEQVRQLQREESIGRLAGGVAHDFNNILMAIQGMTELLRLKLPGSAVAKEHLDKIEAATQRGAALTRQLLAFARKQVSQPTSLALNRLIQQVADILRPLLPADIDLLLQLADDLRPVNLDANQFEQVLINLAVNARDAMPGGGTLTIRTENVQLDTDFMRLHPELLPGDAILLSVSDTGTGMSAEVRARLFEPFFTTKPVGKGTGLGLAMCSGIIKQNRGHIAVESVADQGTTFKIYLPATLTAPATGTPGRGTAADRSASGARAAAAQGERVLFVDDDEVIRESMVPLLNAAGYRVTAAEHGQHALELARQAQLPFDLLITDMLMPRMGGAELADLLRATMPALKVVYTSGYNDPGTAPAAVLQDSAFLAKPYPSEALLRKMRQALDSNTLAEAAASPAAGLNPPLAGKASVKRPTTPQP